MTAIMKSIHQFTNRLDYCVQRYASHHPYMAFMTMFIGLPIFILLAVTACTMIITLPFAWIFGWL